jgi:hypothetical protein
MKLAKVGVEEEEIAGMSRDQLMHAWAKRVTERREEALTTTTAPIKAPGYVIDFERQRLACKIKRFEDEMSWWRQGREDRIAREATEKEERAAREAKEEEESLAREENGNADRPISYKLPEKRVAGAARNVRTAENPR